MAITEDDPTHSSSGEEEEDASSEEEVSESESDPDKNPPSVTLPATKKPSAASSKLPVKPDIPAPAVSSSEDEESGSESESDSDQKISGKSDTVVKPIASKPMDNPPKAVTKPRSKPAASSSPAPAVKTGKRTAPVPKAETNEAKKAKKGDDAEDGSDGAKKTNGDDPKKILFQRLWSEEDEVVILKGMSDYSAKYKSDPIADMNAFHDFIKKSLHVDVNKTQLSDKVRRLKKKYVNNFKKEKTGKERTFSKPHEQVCYNLSKKIWGSDGGKDAIVKIGTPKSSVTAKRYQIQRNGTVSAPSEAVVADELKEVTAMEVDADLHPIGLVSLGGSIPLCESADQMIKNNWKLVAESKRSEWEKKSKKLMVEEVDLYTRRLELMHEQAKLVSEALKSARE